MRALSYILMVLGIYLLVNAGFQEFHGNTTKPFALWTRHRYNTAYLYRIQVLRENNPDLFRQFMTGHWMYATLITGAGCYLFLRTKK